MISTCTSQIQIGTQPANRGCELPNRMSPCGALPVARHCALDWCSRKADIHKIGRNYKNLRREEPKVDSATFILSEAACYPGTPDTPTQTGTCCSSRRG